MKTNSLFRLSACILIIAAFASTAYSQTFPVGYRTQTFTDPARSRDIATYVYYPAVSAGQNATMATGEFPLLIFGHGFMMGYDAYSCYWDSLVSIGYILVFPTTEGGMSPSHAEYGNDLKFLNTYIKSLNTNSGSNFYQHLSGTSAIMGHSMGGGSSFLAAAGNTDITTLINFAAAETTPSAITAAASITVPVLMFSGQNDGVAPPASHQTLMYNALTTCKTIVTITGGGHCYFAMSNWACDFGEGSSSPQPTITRIEQQQVVFKLLIPYLNYMLKGNSQQETVYFQRLFNITDHSYQRNCPVPDDLGVQAIISPVSGCSLNSNSIVNVEVKNYGSTTVSTYQVSHNFNNNGFVSETVNTPIAPGAVYSHTFTSTVDAGTPGATYSLKAAVSATGDNFPFNDSLVSSLTNTSVALPLSVSFTGFTGANLATVFPGWGEAQGLTPAGTTSSWLNRTGVGGASNTTAKVYFSGSPIREWIKGPAFLATSNTILNFDVALTAYNSTNAYASGMGTNDELRAVISTDCGQTWTTLQSFGPAAGFTNTLTQKSISLASYAGQAISVGFVAWRPSSSANSYDLHLDNIMIKNYFSFDIECQSITQPTISSCFGNNENLSFSLKNNGINNIDFSSEPMTLHVQITGPVALTFDEIVNSGTINAGSTTVITLSNTADLSVGGNYTIQITADFTPDQDISNNTTNMLSVSSTNPLVSITGPSSTCTSSSIALDAIATPLGTIDISGTNNTTFAIPDNNTTGIQSPITIAGTGQTASEVYSVTLGEITHTFLADLDIYLIAPNNSQIELTTDNGGSGDHYTNTVFISSATTAITAGVDPFTGNYLPEQPFTNLTGSADGIWKLKVVDDLNSDIGSLYSWSIRFFKDGSIVSYNWSEGSTTPSITVTPTANTLYEVTVTDNNGCTSHATHDVTVSGSIIPVSLGNDTAFCENGQFIINLNGYDNYLWSDNSTGFSYTAIQSEIVSVTVTDACGSSNDQVEVTVYPLPEPQLGNDTILCENLQVTLDAGNGYTSYLWSIGSTSGQTNAIDTAIFTGTQIVYVTVTDANTCEGTASISITFDVCGHAAITSDNTADFWPNPTSGNIHFDPIWQGAEVKIYNASGLFTGRFELNMTTKKLNLAKGIYMLILEKEGKSTCKRLIIE